MARSDKRYSVYPAPKAIEVLGDTAPALNRAIECWAALLARAIADNAKTFWPSYLPLDEVAGTAHFVHDWGVLADSLKGVQFDPEFANPGYLLASAVEDAHRLERVGDKWLDGALDGEWYREVDPAISKLVEKLRVLDYAHAWALIVTVQWYWEHCHEIGKDERWWTLALRRGKSPFRKERAPTKDKTKSKRREKKQRGDAVN